MTTLISDPFSHVSRVMSLQQVYIKTGALNHKHLLRTMNIVSEGKDPSMVVAFDRFIYDVNSCTVCI